MSDTLSIEAEANDLFEAANRVNQIVPAKSTKPALESMLFQVQNGCLEISGSNLQVSITSRVPEARIVSSGSMLLNGAQFVDLLKRFKGSEVKISTNSKGHCNFTSPGASYKLLGSDPQDFPPLPRFDASPGYSMKGSELVDLLQKAEFAVSADQIRGMNTQGVAFELQPTYVRTVGTDTRRLSIAQRSAEVDPSITFSVVLPITCVKAIMKAVSKDIAEHDVVIGCSGPQVFIRSERFTVASSTLLGNYPPYQSALGMSLAYSIDMLNADFRRLLQRAVVIDESSVTFCISPGEIALKSRSREVGVGDVTMEVSYNGPPVTIGFNPKFFDDALGVMKHERCRFRFESPLKAGMVTELYTDESGAVVESENFCYMVMPMMLESARVERDE